MYVRTSAVFSFFLALICGCSGVSNEEFDDRLTNIDMDGDGVLFVDDCDDRDPNVGLEMAWYVDGDGDSYGSLVEDQLISCDPIDGYVLIGGDCDDSEAYVNPSSDEICWDLIDNNCDTLIDDSSSVDAVTWYLDSDGDSYGDETGAPVISCEDLSATHVLDHTDCDDADSSIYPESLEYCDQVDNDCDTEVDEDDAVDVITWYSDLDGDGFGDSDDLKVTCYEPYGYVELYGDCDDGDSTSYPGAAEYCDGVDHDCDTFTYEGDSVDASLWYLDSDGDGFGDPTSSVAACTGGGEYISDNTDCDDSEQAVNPNADEYCDTIDNNCDTFIDEDTSLDAATWYIDNDSDGYGTTSSTTINCSEPSGYAPESTDCDDTESHINPGADDGPLNDYSCDGLVDSTTNLSNSFIEFTGEDANDQAGYAVSTIGDIDGDGLSDIAFSAPYNNETGSSAGKVYIFLGKSLTVRGTMSVSDADVMFTGAAVGDKLGFSLDGGGDFDGDGIDDLIIGAPGDDTSGSNAGAVYLISGQSINTFSTNSVTNLIWNDGILVGENAGDQAGYSVSFVDDFYGDGRDDIVIGAPGWALAFSQDNAGIAYIFRGDEITSQTDDLSDSPLSFSGIAGNSGLMIGDKAGFSVAGFEDADLDGRGDVIVGAPYCDEEAVDAGCAYIILSDTNRLFGRGYSMSDADIDFESEGAGDHLGWRVASAGDFNDDQIGDILISSPGIDVSTTDSGEATLYSGERVLDSTSIMLPYHYYFEGSNAGDTVTGVSAAGDVDGDGVDDIIISAPSYLSGSAIGASYLLLSANHTSPGSYDVGVAAYNFVGESNDDESGYSVSSAGDVNGDGLDDLLVSAPLNDDVAADSGKIYLILSGL